MQFYLPGITPTFWTEVESLPTGIYNKGFDQAPSVPINQLLVAFINRPAGTEVGVFLNDALIAKAKVIDDSGLVYAKIGLPHSDGQETLEIQIKETSTGIVLENGLFATNHMGLMFEIQAKMFDQQLTDAEQVAQDNTITGVESALLEPKFGVFTGLSQRNDQTELQYRNQTACLWRAFQYASMEKGLVDAIKCLIGSTATVIVTKSKDEDGNLIFNDQQFVDNDEDGYFIPSGERMKRKSWRNPPVNDVPDRPHYYVHDRPDDFYLPPLPFRNSAQDIILNGMDVYPGPRRSEPWDIDVAKPLTIKSVQAIGNEIIVQINEADALITVASEQVMRTSEAYDQIANINIASMLVTVTTTGSGNLPKEELVYIVVKLTGEISWLSPYGLTSQTPQTGTEYTISYSFRLDEAIRTVIKQIKPVQKSVVVKFVKNVASLWISEYFDSLNDGDLDTQAGWVRMAGAANSIEVTQVNPIQGRKSALMKQVVANPQYYNLVGAQDNYDIWWDWKYVDNGMAGYMRMLGMDGAFSNIQWQISMDESGQVYADFGGTSFPGTLLGTILPLSTNRFRVRVTTDGVMRFYVNNLLMLTGLIKMPANDTSYLGLWASGGAGSNAALFDELMGTYYSANPSGLPPTIEV